MKKIIISIICIVLFITVLLLILFTPGNEKEKNKKYDKNVEDALTVITFQNDVVEKKDLKFVKVDKDGRYVFKVKNKGEYYYVDLIDRSFEYSEY